jgi:hypothetical protein
LWERAAAAFPRTGLGEGSEHRDALTPLPTEIVETPELPSPDNRAFTPVFDGLWGEGTNTQAWRFAPRKFSSQGRSHYLTTSWLNQAVGLLKQLSTFISDVVKVLT